MKHFLVVYIVDLFNLIRLLNYEIIIIWVI